MEYNSSELIEKLNDFLKEHDSTLSINKIEFANDTDIESEPRILGWCRFYNPQTGKWEWKRC